MRGVDRSDSLNSDASRPKVSFHRDVRVKRIGVRDSDPREDVLEAQEVLRKARSVESIAHAGGTLPRSKKRPSVGVSGTHSLDRRGRSEQRRKGSSPNDTLRRNPNKTPEVARRIPITIESSRKPPIGPKKQLSPILETESPNFTPNEPQYATVRRKKMDSPPSQRIRRLIDNNSETFVGTLRSTSPRRHSDTIEYRTSIHHQPPPPQTKKKKSLPERVKGLFTKKKKNQENNDPLAYSRFNGYSMDPGYGSDKREEEMKETWFKSLDRRIRNHNHKYTKVNRSRGTGGTSSQEDTDSSWPRRQHKPARSYGDTEDESDGPRSQSSKSVVYLHSPAVTDIPGKREGTLRKTVTRSVSVLGPWKPNERPLPKERQVPIRPPRKLVFTGPSIEQTKGVQRSASLYSQHGKTRN